MAKFVNFVMHVETEESQNLSSLPSFPAVLSYKNSRIIIQRARDLGFIASEFINLKTIHQTTKRVIHFYDTAIANAWHGEMAWLAKNRQIRQQPELLLKAKSKNFKRQSKKDKSYGLGSILCLSYPYPAGDLKFYQPTPNLPASLSFGANMVNNIDLKINYNLAQASEQESGLIASYARGQDYHLLLKQRLKILQLWLQKNYHLPSRVLVDSAPLFEKPLAAVAGLGWQGKHTNLLSTKLGNWFFLAELLLPITVQFPKNSAVTMQFSKRLVFQKNDRQKNLEKTSEKNFQKNPSGNGMESWQKNHQESHCGTCRKCLDICPTNAFPAPYQLDARRCISYLTIEHKGMIDKELRPLIGNMLFGCDLCIGICPFNKFAKISNIYKTEQHQFFSGVALINLQTLLTMTKVEFEKNFHLSPIKRLGLARLKRNSLIVLANMIITPTIAEKYQPLLTHLLQDESELVVASGIWWWRRMLEKKLLPDINYQQVQFWTEQFQLRTEMNHLTNADEKNYIQLEWQDFIKNLNLLAISS